MTAFEAERAPGLGEVTRGWRGPRIALYVAGVAAGVGIGAGVASFSDSGEPAGAPARDAAAAAAPVVTAAVATAPVFELDAYLPALAFSHVYPYGPAWNEPITTPADDPSWVAPVPSPVAAEPAVAPAAAAPSAPVPAVPPASAPAAPAAPVAPASPPANTAPAVPPQSLPQVPPAKPNFYVPEVSAGPMTDIERRFLDGVNAERVAAGLAPYTLDAGLSKIARTRSRQMVDQDYFGHKDPYGYSMYVELLAHFGYTSYAWAGENLALNNFGEAESPERAVALLMTSPTHKANILDSEFSRVGVGEAMHADGRHVYTMIFLAP